ncbi:cupin domain-containing protein [Nitratireductor sp. GISD-1A_MAKvit]|uniref:cupin domain-containing protein n=1 Tax=Nitratireductor sp. GISD-1A_MAKvit TaxID=3234198 RepID=UPI003467BD52
MRPFLEKLPVIPGASWSLLNRRLDEGIPFEWHHHPEYELTLTLNSKGQRFIGDHVGEYEDGDLVLVGANLPHTWASRARLDPTLPHVALVMWFRHEWAQALGEGFAELRPIAGLVARGRGRARFFTRGGGARPADDRGSVRSGPARALSGIGSRASGAGGG